MTGILRLDPTAEDKCQARDALLTLLADKTKDYAAEELVGQLVQLNPTAEDKRQAREVLGPGDRPVKPTEQSPDAW